MLEVHDINVRLVDLDYAHLTWQLRVTGEDPLDYDFHILRSGGAAGPWEVHAGPLRPDSYDYLDGGVYLQNKLRIYHYRVRATNRVTGEVIEFPQESSAHIKVKPTLVALELQRQERVLWREFAGRRAVLLPKRRFGRRCPRCWDPTTQRRLMSQCLTCFDTGWLWGYHQPIEVHIQIDPTPEVSQNTVNSKESQTNTTARMGSFPFVRPDDVIVEAEGDRWRISQVSTTQRLRAVVHQELQLHQIVRGEVEYDFPIFWPGDTEASPLREFDNPQSPGGGSDVGIGGGEPQLGFPFFECVGPDGDIGDYMLKVEYDRNRNGIVDRSETLDDGNGHVVTAAEVVTHINCTTPVFGTLNPNGRVTGCFGQTYLDTRYNIWYKCTSRPTGSVWRVI